MTVELADERFKKGNRLGFIDLVNSRTGEEGLEMGLILLQR